MEILFISIYLFVLLVAVIVSSYYRRKHIINTGKDLTNWDSSAQDRGWIIFVVLLWPATFPVTMLFLIVTKAVTIVSKILDWLHLRIGELLVKSK